MLHTAFLRSEISPEVNRKGLVTKATGRFYTPEVIGVRLANNAILSLAPKKAQELSLIDPFCGDGRLLAAALRSLVAQGYRGEVSVEGWDIDELALVAARRKLSSLAGDIPIEISVTMRHRDAFSYTALRHFDLVITNPPWDVLKHDRRELETLTPDQRLGYIRKIKEQATFLKSRFPHSQAAKFSGRSQNLARVGIETALGLVKPQGVSGIIFPATLFADQSSARLRAWMFQKFHVKSVDFYPSELRLFSDVDQGSVASIFVPAKSPEPPLILGLTTKTGQVISSSIKHSDLAELDYRIPLNMGIRGVDIQRGFRSLPTFESLENNNLIWAGRELDETNHSSYLSPQGEIAFVKGRMVGRYELEASQNFIGKLGPRIPKSCEHWRVAWRDVSRQTQRRRMQATLVPPKFVTGNSLNVAYMRSGDKQILRWLLGVMNSLVFEFQVRSLSATSHISLGTARQVKVPPVTGSLSGEISTLTERRLAGDYASEIPLEIAVARSYGLERTDFETIVNSYSRLETPFKESLMAAW